MPGKGSIRATSPAQQMVLSSWVLSAGLKGMGTDCLTFIGCSPLESYLQRFCRAVFLRGVSTFHSLLPHRRGPAWNPRRLQTWGQSEKTGLTVPCKNCLHEAQNPLVSIAGIAIPASKEGTRLKRYVICPKPQGNAVTQIQFVQLPGAEHFLSL